MPRSTSATRFAKDAGLNIVDVSWEDNARDKDDVFGPCISDMTLSVENRNMPLIKNTSNFEDITWDVEIDKIPLVVGNHNGSALRTVTLREYLQNFRSYLHAPSGWKGDKTSLLVEEKDQHVICSAQACFLPIAADGESKFNVAIYNYESRPSEPAVLAIVASANGTSAQVLDSRSDMHLYHNNNGQRASYVGQRLSSFRAETGSEQSSDAPMSDSEKQQNMLLIIQVPLKQKEEVEDTTSRKKKGGIVVRSRGAPNVKCDVEAAILKVGADEGPFHEIKDLPIERDPRYPIRVTMQFYKATSNGAVTAEVMNSIAEELLGARKWAVAISSLVTETTNRTTESLPHVKPSSANQPGAIQPIGLPPPPV